MPAPRSSPTSTRSAESGAGAVGTLVGVTVFLTLLLFGTQLALNLYSASTVTAAAFDGARLVAGGDAVSTDDAEAHVRSLLGDQRVDFEWAVGDEVVEVRVIAERPTRLLRDVPLPFDRVERTVRVRREAPR